MFNETKYRKQVINWLQQKHVTLWQTFNLQDEDGLEAAADWFIAEQTSARTFVQNVQNQQMLVFQDRSSLYDGDGMNPPHRPTMFWETSTPITAQS